MDEVKKIPGLVDTDKKTGEIVVREYPVKKLCKDCNTERTFQDYHKSSATRDGLQIYCKECNKRRSKEINTGQRQRRAHAEMVSSEKQRKIAHVLIDNPNATLEELSLASGLTISTVKGYLVRGTVLKALRALGSKEITRMIPQALQGLRESLTSPSADIKFKASTKLLESERVMGPNRLEIGVGDLQNESTERLRQMIKEAKDFPEQVIQEAQVVE